MRTILLSATALFVVLLAGCGGGGGSSSTTGNSTELTALPSDIPGSYTGTVFQDAATATITPAASPTPTDLGTLSVTTTDPSSGAKTTTNETIYYAEAASASDSYEEVISTFLPYNGSNVQVSLYESQTGVLTGTYTDNSLGTGIVNHVTLTKTAT